MKKGVLLVNLGSPKSADENDVREFLRESLMDPLVTDLPYILRKFKVESQILPKKTTETAKAYQKIWWTEGSPLIVLSKRLQKKLQQKTGLPIAIGMRYGEPSIHTALEELNQQEVDEVLVILLYPQYTMSTTWTAADQVMQIQKNHFKEMKLTFLNSFHKHPDYIEALTDRINGKLPSDYDKLVFSYRGIPKKHDKKASQKAKKYKNFQFQTYESQCQETTELACKELGLPKEKIEITFQSEFADNSWLQPSTIEVLKNYPKNGIQKVVVVSPSFVSDCLETLDEISNQGNEIFKNNGGDYFGFIKGLNDNEEWAKMLTKWIKGWELKENEL